MIIPPERLSHHTENPRIHRGHCHPLSPTFPRINFCWKYLHTRRRQTLKLIWIRYGILHHVCYVQSSIQAIIVAALICDYGNCKQRLTDRTRLHIPYMLLLLWWNEVIFGADFQESSGGRFRMCVVASTYSLQRARRFCAKWWRCLRCLWNPSKYQQKSPIKAPLVKSVLEALKNL